jgi:enolase-phosphatase E1
VTDRPSEVHVRAVVLDIEGTTTPIAFVHEVLFPYARARLRAWVDDPSNAADLAVVSRRLAAEHAADLSRGEGPPSWASSSSSVDDDADRSGLVAYAGWLMDRDRKSPGLKLMQGLIWERGYQAGELRGQVYPDVAPALRRWHAEGLRLAIYSSGSALTQRRLFQSTSDGDLAPLISAHFDTAVGAKGESASYARIAHALDLPPASILFVSDVVSELEAARAAGLQVVLCVRPDNPPQPEAGAFDQVSELGQITTRLR